MEFINRETPFPGRRKLVKVDENNVPLADEVPDFVNIIVDEGTAQIDGTPVTAERFTQGNWRDDNCLVFTKRDDDDLPGRMTDRTQIVTKSNGETWIVPPFGVGVPKVVTDPAGSLIKIGDDKADITFRSHPQIQIDKKSTVYVGGLSKDVNFLSDPQTQISSKASQTALEGKQDTNLVFRDVPVSLWTNLSDGSDYPYQAQIPLAEVTEDMIPQVFFSAADAVSGSFSPIAESGPGVLKVRSVSERTVTIPAVIFIRCAP